MKIRASLELFGGGVLILFGVLFLAYLPLDFSDVSTDAIFIIFGLLFVRKGVIDRKESEKDETKPQTAQTTSKSGKQKNEPQKKSKSQSNNR